VIAANALALAVAAGAVFWWVARTRAIRAALASVEQPFVARGLAEVQSNALTAARTLEADLPGPGCFVALTTTGTAALRVRDGTRAIEARGSVAWCSCAAGRAVVELGDPAEKDSGLALLRIDARATGGPLARASGDFPPSAWGEGAAPCADAVLDGWIADHRSPRPALEAVASWMGGDPARASLTAAGFRAVASIPPERRFEVVESSAGDCVVAFGAGNDELSLRSTGGAWLVAHAAGAMAWCSARAATTTVWRDGAGPVVVLAAPATRVGGLLGARECAETAHLRIAPEASTVPDDDLGWDAEALLKASGLAEVESAPLPGEPGAADPRVVALSVSPSARIALEPAAAIVACDPPFGAMPGVRGAVCAGAAPVAWWRRSDAPAGAARAHLPVWLSMLESRREADAIARIPELLSLTRRLARSAFVPTILEGVTELVDGVRVTGRAGEDAIVAVGIGPKAPWAFPYTDSVPWDLGDAPRVIELRPGDAVKLIASPPPNAPRDRRRTIVFRRAAHP
jgi:hypothetical protein